MGDVIKVKDLTMTCRMSPSQWEGSLQDGRSLYIRYRWGCFDVSVNKVNIFDWESDDEWDGIMSTDEMIEKTKGVLDFSACIVAKLSN